MHEFTEGGGERLSRRNVVKMFAGAGAAAVAGQNETASAEEVRFSPESALTVWSALMTLVAEELKDSDMYIEAFYSRDTEAPVDKMRFIDQQIDRFNLLMNILDLSKSGKLSESDKATIVSLYESMYSRREKLSSIGL